MKEFERQKLEIKKELAGARSRIHATSHFWLYLSNAEMTLDLEANEVEVKVLTSLASVAEVTGSKRLSASSGASLLTVRMLLLGA